MEYIRLSNSDIIVSRMCIGGDQFGGYGWGNVDYEEYERLIFEALERGVNFFDTADIYGLGRSETFLGECLKSRRSNVVIGSKFGVRIENGKTFYDNSPEWIEKALVGSLKRLKTDYIDIYYVHYWDGITPIDVIMEKLEQLKEKGYIRYAGLSNFELNQIDEAKKGLVASAQYEFSLARRINEERMIYARSRLGATPITWGSLGRGVLTGKYNDLSLLDPKDKRSREIDYNFHGETYKRNLQIVEEMKLISSEYDKPLSAIALRFILDYIKQSVVIVGNKNRNQLFQNLESFDWHLKDEKINLLNNISNYNC